MIRVQLIETDLDNSQPDDVAQRRVYEALVIEPEEMEAVEKMRDALESIAKTEDGDINGMATAVEMRQIAREALK